MDAPVPMDVGAITKGKGKGKMGAGKGLSTGKGNYKGQHPSTSGKGQRPVPANIPVSPHQIVRGQCPAPAPFEPVDRALKTQGHSKYPPGGKTNP